MKYINMKSSYGTETVDELNPNDFPSRREFSVELRRLVNEYRIAGMDVYTSTRCTKDWKDR